MRSYWIGTGWKMNHLRSDAKAYIEQLAVYLSSANLDFNVFIVPPFTVLADVCNSAEPGKLWVGAQNISWADSGAFTGEISPLMVKDCGATIVELGHSERRTYFAETDEYVNRKVLAALRHGLRPLVCIGDTAEEKQLGVSKEVLARQTRIALHGVEGELLGQVLLAYEPVWAIGEHGTPADSGYASLIHTWIRQQVEDLYGSKLAAEVPILYGGSVDQQNAVSFVGKADIDGLFIGRAAWEPQSFIRILNMVQARRSELSLQAGAASIHIDPLTSVARE